MNTVLQTLFLRRPRIEYVSAAVCPIHFSASGTSFFDHCFNDQTFCSADRVFDSFLHFPQPSDALAFNIYFSTQESGQPFQLVIDGLPLSTAVVFQAGTYYFTVNLAQGGESVPFPSVTADGTQYVRLTIPHPDDGISVNLYKDGVKIISNMTGVVVDSSLPGWYQATKITTDGESSLEGCSPVLLTGVPPPPIPGPDWTHGGTPIIVWHTDTGDFGGTFPPTYHLTGGFDAGLNFFGHQDMSGQAFNFAVSDAEQEIFYTGVAANCKVDISLAASGYPGPASQQPLGLVISLDGVNIIGTANTPEPTIQIIDAFNPGTYSIPFSIAAGSHVLLVFVQGGVNGSPATSEDISIQFSNIP